MKKIIWALISLTTLAFALLLQAVVSHVTPTTMEIAGRLVWSG